MPGKYEVYFTAMIDFTDNETWVNNFISSIVNSYDEDDIKDTFLRLSPSNGSLNIIDAQKTADDYIKNSIINLLRNGDNKSYKKAFRLSNDTNIEIYTIGEARKDGAFDYVWICDLNNYKKVWSLDSDESEHAGGADKNVMFKNHISLPKGSYLLYYNTDDSHSFEKWNSLPPDDPQFWGIAVWPASEKDRKNISFINDLIQPAVSLTKIKDEETKSAGFSLKKDMSLQVLAIGESSRSRLADYGWIINADTREIIWEMQKENTFSAGGAEKNKMLSEEVSFNKGNYIAYFSTDDSHSYEEWNAAPPFDKELWGISVWTKNEADKNLISSFDPDNYKSKSIIAEISRIKNDMHRSKDFNLGEDRRIRIYALGEGVRGRMYDYAWIENENNQTVWEMTYKKTDHAGGAEKNRLFNEIITLPKGNYRIHYESDDSHSYNSWNSDPPKDKNNYGITIFFE